MKSTQIKDKEALSDILVLDEITNRTNRLVRISESSVDSLDDEALNEEDPNDYKVIIDNLTLYNLYRDLGATRKFAFYGEFYFFSY